MFLGGTNAVAKFQGPSASLAPLASEPIPCSDRRKGVRSCRTLKVVVLIVLLERTENIYFLNIV